jgi:TP901 family phage tail tape measure protein
MAGFLGTLFTGRVALNLALPSQGDFNRASSIFGRSMEGLLGAAKAPLRRHMQRQNDELQSSLDNSKALQDRAAKEGLDSTKKDLTKANRELMQLMGMSLKEQQSFRGKLLGTFGKGFNVKELNTALQIKAGKQIEDNADLIENKLDRAITSLTRNTEHFAKVTTTRFRDGLYEMTFALVAFYYQLNQITSQVRDFEEQLINAQSIFQTSFRELADISDQLVRFSTQYGVSVNSTSKVLYQLASAGLTAAESQKVLTDILKLSMATQGDANTLGKLTIQTIRGFGMEMSEAGVLTDKFAFAINKSLIEWQDLSSAVKFAMPFFVATGQSVDQLLGSIEILTNRALEAGIAGRGLRQALAEFAEGADDSATAMAKLGVQTTDSEGNLLQLTEIAKNFSDVMGDEVSNNTELLTTLLQDLNVRGATAFVHLVQNADEFAEAVDNLSNAAGSATQMAEIQQQGLNREIQLVKNALLAPFLLSDEVYVQQGYLNEFHKALHDTVATLQEYVYTGEAGNEVLTEFGFTLKAMATDLLERFALVFQRVLDIFMEFQAAGIANLDILKLYFYPLNTVVYLLDKVPPSLGEIVLGLYIMNKFLPISTALSFLFSESMFAVAASAYTGFTALGLVVLPLTALVSSFLIVGKVFDWFGGKIGAVVTGIFVLIAAIAMMYAVLNPASAAANFGAMIAVGAAVGAVGAALVHSIPKGDGGAGIDADYQAYLGSVGGGGTGNAMSGGGEASAQTLIIDRANFRSDNLNDVDYDSIIRT